MLVMNILSISIFREVFFLVPVFQITTEDLAVAFHASVYVCLYLCSQFSSGMYMELFNYYYTYIFSYVMPTVWSQ